MILQATTTPANFTNASSSITDGFASSTDLGPIVLFVFYAAIFMGVGMFFSNNYRRYAILVKLVTWITGTFNYFLKGVAGIVVVALTFLPIYFVSQVDGRTQGYVALGLVAVVVGYFAIAGFGYVVDIVWERAREQHEMYQRVHGDASTEES